MSKKYVHILRQEIERLNAEIDAKIICGVGYSDEARRHRMLRDVVTKVRSARAQASFWGKAARIVSLF